jgi:hypothetical protein
MKVQVLIFQLPCPHFTFVQGFLFPILLCRHASDHPQEEIAKFGYRLEMKVYNLIILLYFGNLMGSNDFFFSIFLMLHH